MYKLSLQSQAEILRTLVEGCSIRSVERLTGHHRDTIMRLLVEAGKKAELVLDLLKNRIFSIKKLKLGHYPIFLSMPSTTSTKTLALL